MYIVYMCECTCIHVQVSAMHEQSGVVPTGHVIVYIRQDADVRYHTPRSPEELCIHPPVSFFAIK